MAARNPYTREEEVHLVAYVARECPGLSGRQGNKLWERLSENPKSYPWGRTHSWQSWRDRYKTHKTYYDRKIVKYQEHHGIDTGVPDTRSSQRIAFTDEDDKYLVKYLASYCLLEQGRAGNAVYKKLEENAEGKWPWSARHPFQAWRSRYLDHEEAFDLAIRTYQRKHNIAVDALPPKRRATGSQSGRATKRRRVVDTYDSEEEQWSKIDWPSPRRNASPSKIAGPSKVVEVKVEAKEEARTRPATSTSKEQVNGSCRGESDAGVDDDSDDLMPIGSEDYCGEIFQNGTLVESQGHVDEMPGIEEDVIGQEEAHVGDQSSALNGHLSADLEKELKEAEALAEIWVPEEVPPVDDAPSSSLCLPKSAQLRHGSFSRNDFTLVSQSRRLLDDDPFEDIPSSPQHKQNPPPRRMKRLPAIREGAFRNKLHVGTKKKSRETLVEESSDDQETSAAWLPSPHPPHIKEVDEIRAEKMWPPLRGKKDHIEDANSTVAKVDLEHQAAEQRRREKGKQKAAEPDESTEAPVSWRYPPAPWPVRQSQPLRSSVKNFPEPSLNRASSVQRRTTDIFGPPAPLPDTMRVKSPKRHSTGNIGNIGNTMKSSYARTINLRQEIAHRQLLSQRRPSIPRRSSSRTSHVSSFSALEEENRISQQQEFVSQCLMMFSEQFGFSVDMVSKTWEKLQDVGKMVGVLTRVKESADRKMNELMEGVSNVSSTFSEKGENMFRSFESGLGSDKKAIASALDVDSSQSSPFSVVNPDHSGSSANNERRRSSAGGSGGRGRKSLEIRLVDSERASADAVLLYHPLAGTRAGNFDRLVKMGRGEEALEREQRRVSSVALSPLRNTSQEQQVQSQGEAEDQVPGDHDDDMYDEVEIPIQGEDSDDDEDAGKVDAVPDVEDKDEEMGEASFEVGGRMIKVEPDTSQPRLNGLERPYNDVGDEQSEIDDAGPKINGRESPEQEMKFEPDIHDGIKSRSAEEVEAIVVVRGEAERWGEVEDLFRSANRSNLEVLREIEKGFSMEFLMDWVANEFTI